MAKETKAKGLRLTLGGAPDTPHTFPGVPGFFRTDEPVPVGDGYDIPLERARELAVDDGVPLELVDLGPRQVKRLERVAEAQEQDAREGEVTDTEEVS